MSKTSKTQQETNHAVPLDVVPLKPPDMSQNATYSDIYLTVICRMRHIQRYWRMQHEPSQPGSGPPHGAGRADDGVSSYIIVVSILITLSPVSILVF